MKRTINAHKGGRTHRVNARITEQHRRQAAEIKQATGKSVADILEEAIAARYAELETEGGHLVRVFHGPLK
jgi:hypothetical protein